MRARSRCVRLTPALRPRVQVYEGVLNLLVRTKDGNGTKVILNTLEVWCWSGAQGNVCAEDTVLYSTQHFARSARSSLVPRVPVTRF